jgi:hypothetical protein
MKEASRRPLSTEPSRVSASDRIAKTPYQTTMSAAAPATAAMRARAHSGAAAWQGDVRQPGERELGPVRHRQGGYGRGGRGARRDSDRGPERDPLPPTGMVTVKPPCPAGRLICMIRAAAVQRRRSTR